MTPLDVVGTLVDREWSGRENRRLTRLLKAAKIGQDACLEDVRCEPGRGLDKAVLRDLATCRWIDARLNVSDGPGLLVLRGHSGWDRPRPWMSRRTCRFGHVT